MDYIKALNDGIRALMDRFNADYWFRGESRRHTLGMQMTELDSETMMLRVRGDCS